MSAIMSVIVSILVESWRLLLESSVYILFGMLMGGLLKVFLNPSFVAEHLGKGKYGSVIKAALFGIPIPLCSCGVLPAAASLKEVTDLIRLALAFDHEQILKDYARLMETGRRPDR